MKLARLPDGEPEIFHTIQGEGRNAGLPSVFVRVSLCNLCCRWCDTDYTWNWEGTDYRHDRDGEPGYSKYRKEDQIVELSPVEIAERVVEFDCRQVVLTGGEPLVQQQEFLKVIGELRTRDASFQFEVETNGTIAPKPAFAEAIDQFNVSPKLANSGVSADDRCKPGVIDTFAAIDSADFKFVIDSGPDLEEVRALAGAHAIPAGRIFLMPQGRDAATLSDKAVWLADICRENGYRYSDRLHVRLWGDRRGV